MDRWTLSAVGLVVLVALAGCSYDTTIHVSPEVNTVESVGDGEYELNVSVNPDLENIETTITAVRVDGYSLDGEEICSVTFGNLSDPETGTMQCEAFPSLLLVRTPDDGEQVTVETGMLSGDRIYTIQTGSLLYSGRTNGSHRFRQNVFDGQGNRGTTDEEGHVVPTEETYQTMQCKQWKDHRSGSNFAALDTAPWLDWERQPPDRSRHYKVIITNYSRSEALNQTGGFDVQPDGNTYPESEVPHLLHAEIRSLGDSHGTHSSLTRREFYVIIRVLSDIRVNSTERLGPTMQQMRGQYGAYDNTVIECHANPPQHRYTRGEYLKTYVSWDGSTYHVHMRATETVSGRAFENVSAP